MKDWQKGIELDELLKLEKTWEGYNERCLSPFLEMKKNKIAAAIDSDTYKSGHEWALQSRILKVKTKINMYSAYDIPIATVQKGDRVVDRIACNQPDQLVEALRFNEDTFLFINEEHNIDRFVASWAGFRKLGIKINTFGDIQGVYFKDRVEGAFGKREFLESNKLHDAEYKVLTQVDFRPVPWVGAEGLRFGWICDSLKERLWKMNYEFTNHYSNYNKRNSWSAISLRGYSPDWAFITKPAEMSKKWKEENKDVEFKLQDTELRKMFPEVEDLLKLLPGKPHRIRFMNLSPDGGELQRHTDQVDPDAGVGDGKLMRFHFPIETNKEVIFNQWDWDAKLVEAHMKVGECWYIDVRKPHRAVNGGYDMRTHLVVDIEANDKVRALIC